MNPVLLLLGIALLLLLAAVLYLLWKKNYAAASCRKTLTSEGSKVVVRAQRDLQEIVVEDVCEKQPLCFARSNVRAGQSVEFIYPPSPAKVRILLRYEGGEQTLEVEAR